jgi:hypothetical protein
MISLHSVLRLYRCAARDGNLDAVKASCKGGTEASFVAGFDTFEALFAELTRRVDAEGGLEALEDLERMNDFNEFLYGWDD